MTDTSLTTVINIASVGKGLNVTQIHSNREPFSMTRRFNMSGTIPKKPDLIDLVASMSKKEAELFVQIKKNTNYKTNTATVNFGDLTLSQRNHLSTTLGSLRKLDLVKRCKGQYLNQENQSISFPQNTFIINPAYIVPPDAYFPAILHMWNTLE